MRGVNAAHHMGERRPFGRQPMALAKLLDAGHLMAQRLEKARHAIALLRRTDHQGHEMPRLNSLTMSSKTLSRAGSMSEISSSISAVVVIGEALEHGEARLLLAVELVGGQLDDGRHAHARGR